MRTLDDVIKETKREHPSFIKMYRKNQGNFAKNFDVPIMVVMKRPIPHFICGLDKCSRLKIRQANWRIRWRTFLRRPEYDPLTDWRFGQKIRNHIS